MIYAINCTNNQNINLKTKMASGMGSFVGIGCALGLIAKGRGYKFKNKAGNFKNVLSAFKKMEFREKDVIEIASASIFGGFAASAGVDSKNIKAKAKEGVFQLLGNYIVPSLFVGGGIKLNRVLNGKYKFPPATKAVRFALGFASLIAGVVVGNVLSQKSNNNIFNEGSYRKLTWKDWVVQFDNVCLVTSMSSAGTVLAKMASRVIPVAHLIPGYVVGTQGEIKK